MGGTFVKMLLVPVLGGYQGRPILQGVRRSLISNLPITGMDRGDPNLIIQTEAESSKAGIGT